MHPADIGNIIALIIWFISFIMVRLSRKIGDEINANFFLTMEVISCGFMWIFLGFKNGWW